MMPQLMGGGQREPQETSESDSWFVSTGMQETYNTILEASDEWEKSAEARPKGRFSFLSRKKDPIFVVDQAVPPRLYRVRDDQLGQISFELTEVEEGGTSVKTRYNTKARDLIQNFKAKMPIRIPSSISQKVCPSCGKSMLPEFSTCPYCGTKLK